MVRSIVIVAALMTAGSALAQETAPVAAPAANGTVGPAVIPGETREQKLANFNARLKQADTNQDGRLTSTEWLESGGNKSSFDMLDTNRDDVLTYQELRSNSHKLKAYDDYRAAALY